MANPTSITLLPLTALTGSGSGTAVELATPCSCLALRVASDASVSLRLETSTTGTGQWTTVDELLAHGGSSLPWTAAGLDRFVRLQWTVLQGTAACSVAGTAEVVYCSPADISRFGAPAEGLEELTQSEYADACLASTDEADGYIGGAYTLPLTAWGSDLRLHVAKMATLLLFERRGWDPGGPDGQIVKGRERAIEWLNRLANGRLKPPGLADSTPDAFDGGSSVVSSPKRGW